MNEARTFSSPGAFRQSLTDRLRAVASTSKWSLEQLQRQIAYDRVLARLYLTDDAWIVKGATALLARGLSVRASLDIDLFRRAQRAVAEVEFRGSVVRDIGDWFRFELGATRSLDVVGAARVPVVAFVGVTEWVRFHVDLSGDSLTMTGEPDDVAPLAQHLLPDFAAHGYRVYPLVDHIADKITATLQRYGSMEFPSTRYRDLVDLVAILRGATVEADAQMRAVRSEATRRDLILPQEFNVPDRDLWERGYASEAARSLLQAARTLDDALALVRPFVDPVLQASAEGAWRPQEGRWVR